MVERKKNSLHTEIDHTFLHRYFSEFFAVLPPFGFTVFLLILSGAIVLLPPQAQAQSTENPESAISIELSDNPEELSLTELFIHGYALGMQQNPHQLWSLVGGGQADIFPNLFHMDSTTGSVHFNVNLPNQFDITQIEGLYLAMGYSRGIWHSNESTLSEIGAELPITVLNDYETFIQFCSRGDNACHNGNEVYFQQLPESLGALAHETGHEDWRTNVWWVESESPHILGDVALTTSNYNFLSFNNHINNQEAGIQFPQIQEAGAEIYSHTIDATLGIRLEDRFYGQPMESLFHSETYRQLIELLANDKEKRAELDTLIRSSNPIGVFNYIGTLVLSIDPTYAQDMYAYFESNPSQAVEESFLFLYLAEGSTLEQLKQLPLELQTGLLFLGELESTARIFQASVYNSAMGDVDLSRTIDGVTYRNRIPLSTLARERYFETRDSALLTDYEWGAATTLVGQETANQLFQEFLQTGDVINSPVSQEVTALVIVEQLTPTLFPYEQSALVEALKATRFENVEAYQQIVPEGWELPYYPLTTYTEVRLAGITNPVTFTELVFDRSRFTVRSTVQGILRNTIDYLYNSKAGRFFNETTSQGLAHEVFEIRYPQYTQHFFFGLTFESDYTGSDNGQLSILDITHLKDFVIMLAIESQLSPEQRSIPTDHPYYFLVETFHDDPVKAQWILSTTPDTDQTLLNLAFYLRNETYNLPYEYDNRHLEALNEIGMFLATAPPINGIEFKYTTLDRVPLHDFAVRTDMSPYHLINIFGLYDRLDEFAVYPNAE